MKVKIGNAIYDSRKQPILLILEKDDKWLVSPIVKDSQKYLCCPAGISTEDAKKFMKTK